MSGLKRRQWEPYAFASPSLVLIVIVILFPLLYSFYLSLQDFDLSVGPAATSCGWPTHPGAFSKAARLVGSIWTTAIIMGPALVAERLLGLGLALLLSRVARGRPIITALLAIPAMVSPVMAAMAWRMMF